MPVIAYVLIQVKGGKAGQIAEDILKFEGIRWLIQLLECMIS